MKHLIKDSLAIRIFSALFFISIMVPTICYGENTISLAARSNTPKPESIEVPAPKTDDSQWTQVQNSEGQEFEVRIINDSDIKAEFELN